MKNLNYKEMQKKKTKKGRLIRWLKKLWRRIFKRKEPWSVVFYIGENTLALNRYIKRIYKGKNKSARHGLQKYATNTTKT